MDATLTIAIFIAGTIITLIGFFTRTAYTTIVKDIEDIKQDRAHLVEEQGKLKGKLELLEQESRLKLQHIEEATQFELKNMDNVNVINRMISNDLFLFIFILQPVLQFLIYVE